MTKLKCKAQAIGKFGKIYCMFIQKMGNKLKNQGYDPTKIVYLTNRNLHFLQECEVLIEKSYFWQNYKVKVKSQAYCSENMYNSLSFVLFCQSLNVFDLLALVTQHWRNLALGVLALEVQHLGYLALKDQQKTLCARYPRTKPLDPLVLYCHF